VRIAIAGGTGVVGRYVVAAAEAAGHEPVVLSRSGGVDLVRGTGLAEALEGAEVIVDAANSSSISRARATAFSTQATRHLQDVGASCDVAHLVSLSIVGIDRIPGNGYYQAKVAQEEEARKGPIPVTVVRATQFHEFPAQILGRVRKGPIALMPIMRTQPIAARTVAQFLLEAALRRPDAGARSSPVVEIAGPEPEDLVTMARMLVRRRRLRVAVFGLWVPGSAGRAMRDGSQLPRSDARLLGPTFAEWLTSDDAGALAF